MCKYEGRALQSQITITAEPRKKTTRKVAYMIWSPKIQTLSENFHRIHLRGTSVILIKTSDGPTLVDSGFKWSVNALEKSIKPFGFSISDIRQLLITHYHPDHSGGLHSLKNKEVSKILVHSHDNAVIVSEKSVANLGSGS